MWAAHAHSGIIHYLTANLQEYLKMEQTLKTLPEFSRLTEEDNEIFKVHFKVFKLNKKAFVCKYTTRLVKEVIAAHECIST